MGNRGLLLPVWDLLLYPPERELTQILECRSGLMLYPHQHLYPPSSNHDNMESRLLEVATYNWRRSSWSCRNFWVPAVNTKSRRILP